MNTLNVVVNTTIPQTGIWLYATLNDNSGTPIPSLPTNTPVQLSTLSGNSFEVPVGFSGRIYFFLTEDSSKIPSKPSGINTTINVRYDWVEMTYDGTPTACVNLTSVDQFGIALTLQTQDGSGKKLQSVGYNEAASSIISTFASLAHSAVQYNGSAFIRVRSPLHAVADYPSLNDYLQNINEKFFIVSGMFDGNPGLGLPAIGFEYECTFNYKNEETIYLVPMGNSSLQGTIEIPCSSLPLMIYACDGSFNVPGTTAGPAGNGNGDTVGYNDSWSTVVRNFLVGFNVGYYGYMPAPASNGYKYNCNYSWDWSPEFAYQYQSQKTPINHYYNQYASTIYNASNSYGFPFSDFIGKPLVGLNNVSTLQISLLNDSETNHDYTAPPTGSLSPVNYLNPTSGDGTQIAIIFDCGVGQPMYYSGSINLMGSDFSTGYNNWWSGNPPRVPIEAANCTVNQVPCYKSSICQYTFTIRNKPFNLYLQTDNSGNICSAAVDVDLNVTISASQTSVTISNIFWSLPQPLPA